MSNKVFLTAEQALSVLPDRDLIHTCYNSASCLIGADWSRADIVDKLRKSDVIELTGELARRSGHGICAYNKDTKFHDQILFIETDEDRLVGLEKEVT